MIAIMRYHLFCLYFGNKGNIFTTIVMILFESHLPFYGQTKYAQTKRYIAHSVYMSNTTGV